MSGFDWFDLDVRLLRLLTTVVDTGSITGAAYRLGVTQSAVSHLLQKLRMIVGDELFVKSGRGIRPTPRAQTLAARARDILRDLEDFAAPESFDPARWRGVLTIAANDFQREILLPPLALRLRAKAPDLALRVIPSNVPAADMLREDLCQLILSPRRPRASISFRRNYSRTAIASFLTRSAVARRKAGRIILPRITPLSSMNRGAPSISTTISRGAA